MNSLEAHLNSRTEGYVSHQIKIQMLDLNIIPGALLLLKRASDCMHSDVMVVKQFFSSNCERKGS